TAVGPWGASVERVARVLEVRQADVLDEELVSAEVIRRVEAGDAARGDEVVLIDAIAADAEAADQGAILVDARAAGEEDDAVLVGEVRLLVEVRVGVEGIVAEHGRV